MNRLLPPTAFRGAEKPLDHVAAFNGNARDATPTAIAVYGCEPDEADMFAALAPRLGALPTMTSAPASATSIMDVPGARCASVGHKAPLGRSVLSALKSRGIEYVSTRSIGLDHIDLGAAAEIGLTVGNVAYEPDGVADFTVMLLLMVLRNHRELAAAVGRGDFRLPAARGRDLRDLTVGVVGTGRIGSAVIDRLRGFRCRLLACGHGPDAPAGTERLPLGELLALSDVVTLHLPLNAGTRHCIGAAEIAAMKPGAVLVNTGRGALVDTAALIAAIEDRRLGGAALDVIEGEEGLFYSDCRGRPIEHPFLPRLLALPNVIVTPHVAYYTGHALHDAVAGTILDCRRFDRSHGNG